MTNCAQVRNCLDDGNGLDYNPATGVFSVCISPNANNGLSLDANGCLFVNTGAATVTTGCGILGNGSAANPVRANTSTWAFACAPETNGSLISCDANGRLKGEPAYHSYYFESFQNQTFPANPTVPVAQDTIVQTFTFAVTNPDPCRSVRVVYWRDLDVDFTMPPGSSAAAGMTADEMFETWNTGSSTMFDSHTQVGKWNQAAAALAPGASLNLTIDAALGKGSGGATYQRFQTSIRCLMITN